MSLNYDLSQVKNFKEIEGGTVQLVCFMTMFLGIHKITEETKEEFKTRWHMHDAVFGTMGNYEPKHVEELTERFIGLTTNASELNENKWKTKVYKGLRDKAEKALQASLPLEEPKKK